jgi:hypothetical protein
MTSARKAQGSIFVQDITNFENIFDSNRTYAKGAVVLHMLRAIVGDEVFFKILRAYTASPSVAYKTAITEDFQAIAEQVYGHPLGYFFKEWIYGEGYPSYRAIVSVVAGSTTTTVRLQQRNATATNPVSFTMPVQIRVQSASGDTTVTVFNDQPDQTFTVPARGTVTGIVIDPNNLILKAVETTTINPITAINEPAFSQVRIHPNPTTESLTIDFSTKVSEPVTFTVTNMLGQQVKSIKDLNFRSGTHSQTIDLHGLAAGQYTLTIQGLNGRYSQVVLID